MKKYQSIFQRMEMKYLLTYGQWDQLLEKMEPHMQLDGYGKHLIANIYYDTDSWYLARHSLAKPAYKEKVRLRSYGTPQAGDTVFLELKKKYDGIVYKRRTSMPLKQAERFLNHQRISLVTQKDQILHEFDYVLSFYPDLKPAMYLSYERLAYFGKQDPDVRITFDQNILYRTEDLSLMSGSYGKAILPQGKILMEVKIAGGMPLWLSAAMTELAIYPAKFSKYTNGYLDQLQPAMPEEKAKQEVWSA